MGFMYWINRRTNRHRTKPCVPLTYYRWKRWFSANSSNYSKGREKSVAFYEVLSWQIWRGEVGRQGWLANVWVSRPHKNMSLGFLALCYSLFLQRMSFLEETVGDSLLNWGCFALSNPLNSLCPAVSNSPHWKHTQQGHRITHLHCGWIGQAPMEIV